MISLSPAVQQPQISPLDWAGEPQLCPKWVGFPSRAGLPASLIWSGEGEVPALGTCVHIYMNGFGSAEVKAYFHADGYLGIICQPLEMPGWYQKQSPSVTLGHFFGRELDPFRPQVTPALALSEAEQLARWCEAADQAHEANSNNPAIIDPSDWIPDYLPEGDITDNQDSTECPEHPQGEQRS